MAYVAMLKFPDCCENWLRRHACFLHYCHTQLNYTEPSTKKPQQQTTPKNCPSLFLSFYTTKFSIQPNYNPTRWNMTKKFQMEDDKKNQNGRRQKQFQNIQNWLGTLHAPFGVSFIFSSCTLWKTTSTENDFDGGRQHWRWGFVSSLARFFMRDSQRFAHKK